MGLKGKKIRAEKSLVPGRTVLYKAYSLRRMVSPSVADSDPPDPIISLDPDPIKSWAGLGSVSNDTGTDQGPTKIIENSE